MHNAAQVVAQRPNTLIVPADLACYYLLHDQAATLVDALGNGPDLTLTGAGGSEWANAGYLTPDGAGDYVRVAPGSGGVLEQILDFSTVDPNAAIIMGFEVANMADVTATWHLLSLGGSGTNQGYFQLKFSTAEAMQSQCRANGSNIAPSNPAMGFDTTGSNTRHTVCVVAHSQDRATMTWQSTTYVDGVYIQNTTLNFNEGAEPLGNLSFPTWAPNGLTLFASPAVSPGTLFNNTGGVGRLVHAYFQRLAQHDAAKEARIAMDLWTNPGARPRSARVGG